MIRKRVISVGSLAFASLLLMTACAGGPTEKISESQAPETSASDSNLLTPTDDETSESGGTVEAEESKVELMPGKGPKCPTDHCVSVTVSGDLLFHEGLWSPFAMQPGEDGKNFDFEPLFEGLRPYLEKSDLNICQAETPFAESGGPYAGFPYFNTPPEVAYIAKDLGFDVCTTASNHSVDQGTEGLLRSLDVLEDAGIEHTGTYREPGDRDEVLITEANGVKIAIITSTFSLNGLIADHDWQVDYPLEPERVIEKAKKARQLGADLVLASVHAGEEYWSEPNETQILHTQALIESGEFDFIYSHHTHSIQPIEEFDGTWVVYGTGNLISESAPYERRVNNEFLLTRVQFAKQDDGSWETNDVAWVPATNMQDGSYKWCSVASDSPQGVCQGVDFDADVRERTRQTVDAFGANENGAHEWLVTEE